jgi:hypothetical protein
MNLFHIQATLKMEAESSSETLVHIYETTHNVTSHYTTVSICISDRISFFVFIVEDLPPVAAKRVIFFLAMFVKLCLQPDSRHWSITIWLRD